MENRHTPGPWTHEDGEILANDGGVVVAQVMGADDFPCCEEDIDAECKANAALLSAAPYMLETLESIAETLDKMAPCPEEILDQLLAQAQSAIRNAKP